MVENELTLDQYNLFFIMRCILMMSLKKGDSYFEI